MAQAVPVYLLEMSLPSHRGSTVTIFRMTRSLGFLLASLLTFIFSQKTHQRQYLITYSWRLALSAAGLPASLLILGAFFLPDTLASLLQRGRLNLTQAVGLLQSMRATSHILSELNDTILAADASSHPPPNHFLMVIVVAIPFFSRLTGSNLVLFYTPVALHQEWNLLVSTCTVTLGLVALLSNIASAVLVDKLGRRVLLIIGGGVMLVSHVLIGIAWMMSRVELVVFPMMCVFMGGYELSWGPVGWVVVGETFPLWMRSEGMGIAVAIRFLVDVVELEVFARVVCTCGVESAGSVLFLVYGGFVGCMTVFVWLVMAETKKVKLERVEEIWRGHRL